MKKDWIAFLLIDVLVTALMRCIISVIAILEQAGLIRGREWTPDEQAIKRKWPRTTLWRSL